MRSKHLTSKKLIALLASLALMLACSLVTGTPNEPPAPLLVEPQPVASNTPRPTDPPRPTNTTTPTLPPSGPSCYKWDQITLEMEGEELCVYGVAFSQQGKSRIDFSPEKNSFFLIDSTYYYPNLTEGVCVVTKEKVDVFDGKIPFMTINGELYKCEPWMEE